MHDDGSSDILAAWVVGLSMTAAVLLIWLSADWTRLVGWGVFSLDLFIALVYFIWREE